MERQATGGTLLDKIEIDRSRPVRPIRISVRRGAYPPRFRSTRCMMFARCSAEDAHADRLYIPSHRREKFQSAFPCLFFRWAEFVTRNGCK